MSDQQKTNGGVFSGDRRSSCSGTPPPADRPARAPLEELVATHAEHTQKLEAQLTAKELLTETCPVHKGPLSARPLHVRHSTIDGVGGG
jgi:hypothetical protein